MESGYLQDSAGEVSYEYKMYNETVRNETFSTYQKPHCYTTVAWRTILLPNQNLAIGLSYSATVIPAVLLNSVYCCVLYKTKQLKKKAKLLVFLQSFSDFLSGLFSIPGSVVLFAVYGNTRCCSFERILMFFGQANGHLGFYLLIMIAIQRYFACKPLGKFNNRFVRFSLFTFKGLKITVVLVIMWSIFHGLVSVYFFGHVKSTVLNIMVMVIRTLVLVLTYIIYFRLYFSIKEHQRDMAASKDDLDESYIGSPTNKKYSAFVKTVYLVLIAYAVSFVPILVADCWTGYFTFRNVYAPRLARFIYYLAHCTFFFNSSINTAIYLYRDEDSIAFLKKKLCTSTDIPDETPLRSI